MTVVEYDGEAYFIDKRLAQTWDKIRLGKLCRIDSDRVFIVDGRERSGKSVFARQQACYIDPSLVKDMSRVCFTADEFLDAIKKTDSTKTETKCIIFDEAFRGLASRSAMSKTNKKIIQALMEVGQKNLTLFIVLPSFFMLDIYPAMLRSNALFHIKQDKRGRRVFYCYSYKKKGKLYQAGLRKGWNYVIPTRFKSTFPKKFPGGDEMEKLYRQKKYKSLVESENLMMKPEEDSRRLRERNEMVVAFASALKLGNKKLSAFLKTKGIQLSPTQIQVIRTKYARNLETQGVKPSENLQTAE